MSLEAASVSEATMLPSSVRLLLVDDDVAICRQMATGLATAGFQVVTANDAENAFAQAASTPPDVAIVDLEMPGVGGLAVIAELKRLHGGAVHVMVLTGHDDEQRRADAFEAGADDYVVKPVPMSELRRRVSAAVRTQRAFVHVRLEKEAAERRLVYGQEASALLAHDLNNGLAVSLNNLAYLVDVIKGDAEVTDAIAATLRSVRRMSGLVANFVDIARFEDAAVKPTVALTNVRDLLQSVIDVHAASIARGVTFENACDPALQGRFDAGLVERVLHNLFGNAARYCGADGTIRLGGRPWPEPAEGAVEIWVANTGPQIPENIRGTLFGKYVQGKGGKRGMGLYFCRLVAEAHGGRIAYEARPDGPSFVLRLPGRV
ncbi:MAG TPA: response regulator [Kofleriaceae bacterium]|nr:response regulator [Kofleriaceae bacterium]